MCNYIYNLYPTSLLEVDLCGILCLLFIVDLFMKLRRRKKKVIPNVLVMCFSSVIVI